MKFNELTTAVTRGLYKAKFQLKKHSPEILVVGGVIGTVASTVMACKATTKVNFVLEETKHKVDIIHEGVENGEVKGYMENGEVGMIPYSAEDSKKDLAIVYGQTGIKLAKLYGPAVLVGAVSITSILVGCKILHNRSLAYAAAYTAADNTLKRYRGNVVERFGEKMDQELLYNIKAKEIEEVVVNEDGSETVVTKTVEVADSSGPLGIYTFCFDESSRLWVRNADKNKFALLQQQAWANDMLRSRGVICLNDVLEMVGLDRVAYGQTVGWVDDGVTTIDFGIFNIACEANRNFVNGLEKSIWLNFNVQGDITHAFAAHK
jgi:hypothetical protein